MRVSALSSRAANASIKGYLYQFDHTIVQVLSMQSSRSPVVIEGIEDVVIENADETTFVQCKYYEGTEYNHSQIKHALIHMLKNFHAQGCRKDHQQKYRLYGHYKRGIEKLPDSFGLEFLKKNFLTYKRDGKEHKVYEELKISDVDLDNFQAVLEIDIRGMSYEEQQEKIHALLMANISQCQELEAKVFYYPIAINLVQRLAIKSDEKERSITKEKFISEINRKEVVFSLWLRQKFGNEYYAKSIRLKYFKFPSTKIPRATRVFILDMNERSDFREAISILIKIGKRFSNVEHVRTTASDRFAPYVLLRGVVPEDLVEIKESLRDQGLRFADGYPFHGSKFDPVVLSEGPTRENQIKLKFIPGAEQIKPVLKADFGSEVAVFDLFRSTPLGIDYIPISAKYNPIQVHGDYFNFLGEVL